MEKAYDLKDLLERLKLRGLEGGEEAAKGVIEDVFEWARLSAELSPNQFDDMISGLSMPLKKLLLEKAEMINPADNAPVA